MTKGSPQKIYMYIWYGYSVENPHWRQPYPRKYIKVPSLSLCRGIVFPFISSLCLISSHIKSLSGNCALFPLMCVPCLCRSINVFPNKILADRCSYYATHNLWIQPSPGMVGWNEGQKEKITSKSFSNVSYNSLRRAVVMDQDRHHMRGVVYDQARYLIHDVKTVKTKSSRHYYWESPLVQLSIWW